MSRISDLLMGAREERAFSGAAYVIGRHDVLLEQGSLGTLSWGGDDVGDDTLWDLASLTKTISAVGAMVLLEDGALRLEDPIDLFLQDWATTDKAHLTIRQLLTHTSGIPGQQPLYWGVSNNEEMLETVRRLPLRFGPGSDVEYTSQGFMVLGRILELISGQRLDALLRETVFEPIGMDSTLFTPPPELQRRAAATEDCPWRHRVVQGEVHDENAVVMGGIAAHAGIFSTATDMALLCQMMLSGGRGQRRRVLSPESVECMTRLYTRQLRLARCLGWQGKDRAGSPGGDLFTDRSYGHTGFTGTSVWIDPSLDLFAVLLTNRVHPSRQNETVVRLRPRFHNVAVSTWGGPDRD